MPCKSNGPLAQVDCTCRLHVTRKDRQSKEASIFLETLDFITAQFDRRLEHLNYPEVNNDAVESVYLDIVVSRLSTTLMVRGGPPTLRIFDDKVRARVVVSSSQVAPASSLATVCLSVSCLEEGEWGK